jgi:peroxiredoxin
MSLTETLDRLRTAMLASAAGRRAYQSVVATLEGGFLDHVLPIGAAMPGFVLPNAEGHMLASSDLLARGPLVINFFRGDWCDYCRATLDALEVALPEIEHAGGTLLAVTPDTGGRSLETKRARGLHYEIAVDVDHATALRFGVAFRLPEPYRTGLAANGIDLPARHGHDGWMVPAPATFLIDPSGVVRWRHVPSDPTRRAEPADIVAALVALAA